MHLLFWITVAADVVGFVLLLGGMFAAPVGYEDGQGFHEGVQPVPVRVPPEAGARRPLPDELVA